MFNFELAGLESNRCFVWWFSSGTHVSSNNKTARHDMTEILLKLALNTIDPPPPYKMKKRWLSFLKLYFSNVWSSLKVHGTVGHDYKEDQARIL